MNKKQEYIRQVFFFFAILFVIFLAYFTKLILVDGRQIATNPYNRRMRSSAPLVKHGVIYDINARNPTVTIPND